MKIHVTFSTEDLLGLHPTGNASPSIGRQYMSPGREERPSFYAHPGEMRQIAEHFARLAEWAGE